MRNKSILQYLLILLIITGAPPCWATGDALYFNYNFYKDVTRPDEEGEAIISEELAINYDLRMHRIFILNFHGGSSINQSRRYGGVGLKVDLPGFFLLGGQTREFLRRKKRRGYNTSIYFKYYYINITNLENPDIFGTKLGFSLDYFLSLNYFFSFDFGIFSDSGNQFFNHAVGLGYEF